MGEKGYATLEEGILIRIREIFDVDIGIGIDQVVELAKKNYLAPDYEGDHPNFNREKSRGISTET
jgi:hypothetical protein